MTEDKPRLITWVEYLKRLDQINIRIAHCSQCDLLANDPYTIICLNGHPMHVDTITEYERRVAVRYEN